MPDPRKDIPDMTDREIAEETLAILRNFEDALEIALSNPMIAAMANGQSPASAMMGSMFGR